jgi:putative transposase
MRCVTDEVATTITNVYLDIEDKYDIKFIEIGTDVNHVHYLIQSVPKISLTQIITTIKSLTAKMVFKINPEVKQKLWGGEFWSDGY